MRFPAPQMPFVRPCATARLLRFLGLLHVFVVAEIRLLTAAAHGIVYLVPQFALVLTEREGRVGEEGTVNVHHGPGEGKDEVATVGDSEGKHGLSGLDGIAEGAVPEGAHAGVAGPDVCLGIDDHTVAGGQLQQLPVETPQIADVGRHRDAAQRPHDLPQSGHRDGIRMNQHEGAAGKRRKARREGIAGGR